MLKLATFRFRGRCPKHKKFDPAAGGVGAVKGGCVDCLKLVAIFDANQKLILQMREFNLSEPVKVKLKPASENQAALFG